MNGMRRWAMVLHILLGMPVGALLSWVAGRAGVLAARRSDRDPEGDGLRQMLDRTAAGNRNCPVAGWFGWTEVGAMVATSALLALVRYRHDAGLPYLAVVSASLFFVLVALVDLKNRLVLNAMIVPAACLTLMVRLLVLSESPAHGAVTAVAAVVTGILPFVLAAHMRPGGIGGGDLKLSGLVGLVVGFPQVLWALVLAILSGGAVALFLLASPQWEAVDELPYAPFLCLGAIAALLCDPISPLLFAGVARLLP